MASAGPFPIGTREQGFGADPLENYGGFQKLRYSSGATYPSELVEGGFTGWMMVNSNNQTVGPKDFRNARWKENGVPFGWSIEQYQAWARGVLVVYEPTQLFVQISGASEFYGKHTIDVRMVHDVRMFGGGQAPPQCQFHVRLDTKDEALLYPEDCVVITPSNHPTTTSSRPTTTASESNEKSTSCKLLVPEYLNDIGFASSYGSVSIQNAGDDPMI
ncbi:hypothetical protein [Parasitella parasitica]|uniref:Uncharacterized protein n=1 Tax=Parasitella parasitica TaxID=35722 RepID=A0A0B7MYC7_9FUNG|nr:hypothetical protein [Parasitella parasitica]